MTRLASASLAAGLLWAAAGPAAAQGPSPQTQKINELIAKGWESAGVKKPADKAPDLEFMRRAYIDLIGRIPTPEEIIDFEADKSTGKRAKLINRLLNDEKYTPKGANGKPLTAIAGLKKVPIDYNGAYADNFAELWTTWLLTRSNVAPQYREQFRLWLSEQFAASNKYPGGRPWKEVVAELISATGKSNENGAVVFVIRHLGDPIAAEMGAKPNVEKDGRYDAVPITSRVTAAFLGIKTQCTQCHDHPFNKEYVQSDFWGVNTFFRQADRGGVSINPRQMPKDGNLPPVTLSDVSGWNTPGMVFYERRDGQKRASFAVMLKNIEQAEKGESSAKKLVSESIPPELKGKTRREVLAQWVTEHDNFGRAFVNRMWGHLFGRGLNKEPAVDDFSINNELVHPELLNFLADEFKKYNYDPKKLLEWICTSDVYQLSHVANKAYVDQKYDPYFVRMPLKAMAPEVMFDALATATRAETRKDDTAYKTLKANWLRQLTLNFGDDEGNEINFNGTVVQALLMMNGREINGEIGAGKGSKDGVVGEVVKRYAKGASTNPAQIYDELFLMTVSRHVTPAEVSQLEQVRQGRATINLGTPPTSTGPTPKGPTPKGPVVPPKGVVQPKGPVVPPKGGQTPVAGAAPDDVAFYQDVFWALLNCNEFMLNH